MSPKSTQAIDNIKAILEEHLPGRYSLEIIDIYQQPIFTKDGQIVAAPTLIKELPPPLRKLIGSMADTERVLVGMDLKINSALKDEAQSLKEHLAEADELRRAINRQKFDDLLRYQLLYAKTSIKVTEI